MAIGGFAFLLTCVFGSYTVSGGSFDVLMEAVPFEMWTIGGAEIAAFLMSNSMHDLKTGLESAPERRSRGAFPHLSRSFTTIPFTSFHSFTAHRVSKEPEQANSRKIGVIFTEYYFDRLQIIKLQQAYELLVPNCVRLIHLGTISPIEEPT